MTWWTFVIIWAVSAIIVLSALHIAHRVNTPRVKLPKNSEVITVATTGPFRPGSVARINGEDFLVLAVLDLHHMLVTREVQGTEVRDD